MAGNRVALVLAGVVAGVALTGTGVVLVNHRGGDGARHPGAASVPIALSPEGRELVDLLQRGLGATYHARYQSVIADPRAQGTQMTMDVWRKGTLTRQEVAVQSQNVRTRSGTFDLPPQSFQCTQVGDNPWSCKPPTDARSIDPPEGKIMQEQARGPIHARDDTIAGLAVRCFTFAPGGDLGETCIMDDGVTARLSTVSSRFDIVALTHTVSDDSFQLPAGG